MLTTVHGVDRQLVVDHLIILLQKENVETFAMEKGTVLQALLLCGPSARVSFADALVWRRRNRERAKVVYSLDQRFPVDGIEL